MPNQKPSPVIGPALGLRHWMGRVLEEADKASGNFAPDPVHDLRVALRRCFSMADGLMSLDPDKTWRAMKKEGRQLFRRLGELRDIHVMLESVQHLSPPEDPIARAIHSHLARREPQLKQNAMESLQAFNRKRWRGWIGKLHARTRRVPAGGLVFQLSALQAWNEAHELHKQALRNRSDASYHRLRIGIKKFRYLVENFLPLRCKEWGPDLKELQDCLGEAHDLTLLWTTAKGAGVFPDEENFKRWRSLIDGERATRLGRYRGKMLGNQSLWSLWRKGLPPENRLPAASRAMIENWAFFRGVDRSHLRTVQRLAFHLLDGLKPRRAQAAEGAGMRRAILQAAVVLFEAGRAMGEKKAEFMTALLRQFPPLQDFAPETLQLAAMVVQCQRGKFRGFAEADIPGTPAAQLQMVMELGGILRLARTLARMPVQRIKVSQAEDSVVILAQGYPELGASAEKVARARYRLEYALRKPVLIRSLPVSGSSQTDQPAP